MKMKKSICAALVALGLTFGAVGADISTADAAPVSQIQAINVKADGTNFKYWNEDSESFKALKAYVEDVTNPRSPNFIPVEDRIVVSDMDGTFYGELAPTYSEWYMYFHRIFEDPTYKPTATEKAYAQELLKAAKIGKLSEDMDVGEDMAQAYCHKTRSVGFVTAIILMLIFIFFGGDIVALYNSDTTIIETGAHIMLFIAFMQPFQTSQFIIAGGLRGAGDTKATAMITSVTVLILRPVLAIFLIRMGFGLYGAWMAFAADQLVRSLLVLLRYNSGKWKLAYRK